MRKRRLWFAVLLLLLLTVALTACGQEKEVRLNNTTEYESENLGFSISMDEDLFSVIVFDAYKEGYDGTLDTHKWKNTISAEFDGVAVPLFYVNVYDGEYTEESITTNFPDDVYLGTAEGFTYTMTFSVDGDGAAVSDLSAYQEMMDRYVYDLPEYTIIFGYGDALVHDADNTEPKLAWARALSGRMLSIDPVVMVVDGDEEMINQMTAAGVTPDFSYGYMIWNEQEENAEVEMAEDAAIYLLDHTTYDFVEATEEDLQNRIAEGDLLLSYLTENGRIVEIYEQYLNVPVTEGADVEE